MFKHHPQSPIPPSERESFSGLCYFEYDPAARVLATVDPVEPQTIEMPASEGTLRLERIGRCAFELLGVPLGLDLFWFGGYGGGLFLSFKDATSGNETYGGCRYLLDTVKGADLGQQEGKLVLDFNFAYHPSCVYDSRWVCPLAPLNNRVRIAIRFGERLNKPTAE